MQVQDAEFDGEMAVGRPGLKSLPDWGQTRQRASGLGTLAAALSAIVLTMLPSPGPILSVSEPPFLLDAVAGPCANPADPSEFFPEESAGMLPIFASRSRVARLAGAAGLARLRGGRRGQKQRRQVWLPVGP